MELHLDDADVALLRELLDSAFRDLRFEIGDTDNYEYKQGLIAREKQLRAILDRVGGLIEPA